ncbi:acyl-CoA dehydrogenase family protein [Sorangium sp. So ce134]
MTVTRPEVVGEASAVPVETWRGRVRRFVETEIRPRLLDWEREGRIPPAAFTTAGDLRLLSYGRPLDGRFAPDWRRQRVLVEELTRSGAQGVTMAFAAHVVSLTAVQAWAVDEARAEVIDGVLSGERRIALAVTEPDAGSDLRELRVRALPELDGYRLVGEKTLICSGVSADYLIVLAVVPRGDASFPTLFLVRRDASVRARPLEKLGWKCLDLAALAFDGTPVSGCRRLGAEGQGRRILARLLELERFNLAVMACASAELAYELAHRYSSLRIVGGAPLTQQPVIQQKIAQMYQRLDVTRVYLDALQRRLEGGERAQLEIHVAKNMAVDMLMFVASEALQIAGGAGCLESTGLERVYRDARILPIGGGTTEIINALVFRELDERMRKDET